ncbi:MAG: hypothetical protein WDZ80_04080 [Candidatus Paceibacterota bacterium]
MSKSKVALLVVSIIAVLLIAGFIVWKAFIATPQFSAVSLTTGEIYFGKVVNFPTFGLKQVYTIQINPESQENPVSIQRFANNFWGPEDFMKINRDNVIWVVDLDSSSQLAELIRNNPNLVNQQNQVPQTETVPEIEE